MAFEEFDRRQAAIDGPASVSIQKGGLFALNRAAYGALGEPVALKFLFDPERRVIGLQATGRDEPNAYVLRTTRSNFVVSGSAFCHHYGIDATFGRRFRAGLEGNTLVVYLEEEGRLAADAARSSDQASHR